MCLGSLIGAYLGFRPSWRLRFFGKNEPVAHLNLSQKTLESRIRCFPSKHPQLGKVPISPFSFTRRFRPPTHGSIAPRSSRTAFGPGASSVHWRRRGSSIGLQEFGNLSCRGDKAGEAGGGPGVGADAALGLLTSEKLTARRPASRNQPNPGGCTDSKRARTHR